MNYSDKLSADQQITTEERISAIIFATQDGTTPLYEDDCVDLGRAILKIVLREFRPDLFVPTPNRFIIIPSDFPVQPLGPDEKPKGRATCGNCGLSWDDDISTSMTPAPSARCPFEEFH